MKIMTLRSLDEPIKTLKGAPIRDFADGLDLTYRSALIALCETFRSDNPGSGENIRAFRLGLRVMDAKDSIDLTEDELKVVKSIIDKTQVFPAVVIGRLTNYIETGIAEKVEIRK